VEETLARRIRGEARRRVRVARLLWASCVLVAGWLLVSAPSSNAATALSDLSRSGDIHISLASPSIELAPRDVLASDAGGGKLVDLETLPVDASITAYHIESTGDRLFSLDVPATLGGTLYLPGDVVRLSSSFAYSLEFDSTAAGVSEANVVGLSSIAGDLLLAFDIPVVLVGIAVMPEDVARWPSAPSQILYFVGSAEGVPEGLGVDGVHYLASTGTLLLSFDGSGQLGSVDFDDEDVMEFNASGPAWEMSLDGSAADAAWVAANLESIQAVASAGDNCPSDINPGQVDTDGDLDGNECDSDDDDDGLLDSQEALLGTDPLDTDSDDDALSDFDEVNVHSTEPLDDDSDDDGLLDGAEVSIKTDPNDPDTDGDSVCDGQNLVGIVCASGPDVCPFIADPSQEDADGIGAGDACQCGDVNDDGYTNAEDLADVRLHIVGAELAHPTRCNVVGPSDGGTTDCDLLDAVWIQRHVGGVELTNGNECDDWGAP
jgi:hypothetical protein